MIKLTAKKTLAIFAACLTIASISIETSAQDEAAPCILPTEPIIPDGNVASKEELVGASKAIKALQAELGTYRECLTAKSNAVVGEDEVSAELRKGYIVRYNESVDLEEKVAGEFNSAYKIFKAK